MKVKVKLVIDPTKPAVVAAFDALLNAMGLDSENSTSAKVVGGNQSVEMDKPKEPRATKEVPPLKKVDKPKEPRATKEVPPLKKVEKPAEEEPAEEKAVEGPKIEEIRELLGKKVVEHREAIKAQLTKMEAKNVSVLAKEHYPEFFAFLEEL